VAIVAIAIVPVRDGGADGGTQDAERNPLAVLVVTAAVMAAMVALMMIIAALVMAALASVSHRNQGSRGHGGRQRERCNLFAYGAHDRTLLFFTVPGPLMLRSSRWNVSGQRACCR
jgi:hypothetical protein